MRRGEAVTVRPGSDGDKRPNGGGRPRGAPGPQGRLRQKNRLLGALLAGVAALLLVTALSVAMMLYYAEAHHLFSGR